MIQYVVYLRTTFFTSYTTLIKPNQSFSLGNVYAKPYHLVGRPVLITEQTGQLLLPTLKYLCNKVL